MDVIRIGAVILLVAVVGRGANGDPATCQFDATTSDAELAQRCAGRWCDNIRVPGVEYGEPPEEWRDLQPPSFKSDDDDIPPAVQPVVPPSAASEESDEDLLEREAAEQAYRAAHPVLPTPTFPPDAYKRALEHIRQMPAAEPPPVGTPHSWLDFLFAPFLPRAAYGYQWVQIGPQPGITRFGAKLAGVTIVVTVDPTNSQRVFQGTYGGVWLTWNALGASPSWSPLTDTQPNQEIHSIAILPSNPQVVFAGSHSGIYGVPSAGILRSMDGGTTWCQIGPNDQGGPGPYTATKVAANDITIDTSKVTTRVWAATSAGLFWSQDAYSAAQCAAVTWNKITTFPVGVTQMNHILVSPLDSAPCNMNVLYASTQDTWQTWYRSTDRGNSWTNIGTGSYPNDVGPSVIVPCATSPCACGGSDTIYEILFGAPEVTCNYRSLWRTTNSGGSWQRITAADCLDGGENPGQEGVAVHPTQQGLILYGQKNLWRSTDSGTSFSAINDGGTHVDIGALTFDPSNPNTFYAGTDGGVWSTSNITAPTVSWTNLNTNVSTYLFNTGAIDTLNYGTSLGATHDNLSVKGGGTLTWTQVQTFGDDWGSVIDPTNSNVAWAGSQLPPERYLKTTNGGRDWTSSGPPPTSATFALDPTDHNTAVLHSDQEVFRTTDGGVTWPSLGTLGTGYTRQAVALTSTAPSNIVLAGNCGFLERTVNANGPGSPTWTAYGYGVFPSRCVQAFALDQTTPASPNQGIVYVGFDGLEQNPDPNGSTRHLFRSSDAGQSWTDVSGTGSTGLPDLPVNSVVLHPQDPNTIYAATGLGVFQGTYNPATGTATWGTLMNGLPAVSVSQLATHKDSGVMRAFTYGRSAWETQILPIPKPDYKVNTVAPLTDVQSPRTSSGKGNNFAVAWTDDRLGSNNWHVYYRAYGYDSNGLPTPLSTGEYRVDDNYSSHSVQAVALSANPTSETSSLCSRLAWQDDRLNPGVNQHVYIGAMCSDGYKVFGQDIRADTQQPTNVNATVPAIAFQAAGDMAAAWLKDRTAGSAQQDVAARFFDSYGNSKAGQFLLNTVPPPAGTYTDAGGPAALAIGAGNVFFAWTETVIDQTSGQATDYRVYASKYDYNGNPLVSPVRVDDGSPPSGAPVTVRTQVALGADDTGKLAVSWWEGYNNGPEKVVAKSCSGNLTGCTYLDAQCRRCMGGSRDGNACAADSNCAGSKCSPPTVSCPPLVPAGAQRAVAPAAATDVSGNVVVAWEANVNAPDSSYWNGFARTFNSSGGVVKNDFRVDLHDRWQGGPTRVARPRKVCIGGTNANAICKTNSDCSSGTCGSSGEFPFAWRDNRSGHFDVYTRVVPSLR